MYDHIDCYDSNTPIILKEVQEYLYDPSNYCISSTYCGYPSFIIETTNESEDEEDNKCLIAWALLQQYYNKCPQIVMETSEESKTFHDLPTTDPIDELTQEIDYIDYDSAPKLINPLIYKTFINEEVYNEKNLYIFYPRTLSVCDL